MVYISSYRFLDADLEKQRSRQGVAGRKSPAALSRRLGKASGTFDGSVTSAIVARVKWR
jgi:hypothetical protein